MLRVALDRRTLGALDTGSRLRGKDGDLIRYRSTSSHGDIVLDWSARQQLPVRLERTRGKTLSELTLTRTLPYAPATLAAIDARLAGYQRIDASDFGDMESDPFIRKAERIDVMCYEASLGNIIPCAGVAARRTTRPASTWKPMNARSRKAATDTERGTGPRCVSLQPDRRPVRSFFAGRSGQASARHQPPSTHLMMPLATKPIMPRPRPSRMTKVPKRPAFDSRASWNRMNTM